MTETQRQALRLILDHMTEAAVVGDDEATLELREDALDLAADYVRCGSKVNNV
jgi:hypothetical protein